MGKRSHLTAQRGAYQLTQKIRRKFWIACGTGQKRNFGRVSRKLISQLFQGG
jgi:hypothetical protein